MVRCSNYGEGVEEEIGGVIEELRTYRGCIIVVVFGGVGVPS